MGNLSITGMGGLGQGKTKPHLCHEPPGPPITLPPLDLLSCLSPVTLAFHLHQPLDPVYGPRVLCSRFTYPCSGSGYWPLVGILAPGMQLLFFPAGSLLCLSLRVPLDHTPAPTPDSTGIYPGWAAAIKPDALPLSVSLAPWRGTGMTGCAGCFISHQVVVGRQVGS